MKIILQINHEPFSFIKTYVQFLWSTNYVDMSSGCLVTFDEEKKHKLSLDHIWGDLYTSKLEKLLAEDTSKLSDNLRNP